MGPRQRNQMRGNNLLGEGIHENELSFKVVGWRIVLTHDFFLLLVQTMMAKAINYRYGVSLSSRTAIKGNGRILV